MDLTVPSHRNRARLSVPGLSLFVHGLFACALCGLAVVWLSPVSFGPRVVAVLAAIIGFVARLTIVSLSTMGRLLVISNGVRDTYIAADDLVSVTLGRSLASMTVVRVGYRKQWLGMTTTKWVRTFVWQSESKTVLQRIENLFGKHSPNNSAVPTPVEPSPPKPRPPSGAAHL